VPQDAVVARMNLGTTDEIERDVDARVVMMNHSFEKLGGAAWFLAAWGVCDADGCDDALVARDETESAVRLRQQSRRSYLLRSRLHPTGECAPALAMPPRMFPECTTSALLLQCPGRHCAGSDGLSCFGVSAAPGNSEERPSRKALCFPCRALAGPSHDPRRIGLLKFACSPASRLQDASTD
jgi:hypothetical protein